MSEYWVLSKSNKLTVQCNDATCIARIMLCTTVAARCWPAASGLWTSGLCHLISGRRYLAIGQKCRGFLFGDQTSIGDRIVYTLNISNFQTLNKMCNCGRSQLRLTVVSQLSLILFLLSCHKTCLKIIRTLHLGWCFGILFFWWWAQRLLLFHLMDLIITEYKQLFCGT